MAWVRCCGGGTPSVTYPIDLLTYSTWTVDPTASQSIANNGTKYWNMINKTPRLKANATIEGTFNNMSISSVTVYLEVSVDGNTWDTVITCAGASPSGQTKFASLAAYANQELYIRLRATNTNPNTLNVRAVYSSTTPYLQIS